MSIPVEIQKAQSAHRWRLIEAWDIPVGARILEIGCGQGDMTAVLVEHVGPTGSVVAIDLAKPDYGAPETLAEATQKILDSEIGARVKFHFERDIRDGGFQHNEFDVAVMAHCSWYFENATTLSESFAAILPYASQLAFAEWDLQPKRLEQLGHYLAVQIQALVEASKLESEANIRTPLSRDQLLAILHQVGWKIETEHSVESPDLQDADWEIKHTLTTSRDEATHVEVAPKILSVIESQLGLLQSYAKPKGNRPLSVYALTALAQNEIALTFSNK